jgi:signal transduction histidine kinase
MHRPDRLDVGYVVASVVMCGAALFEAAYGGPEAGLTTMNVLTSLLTGAAVLLARWSPMGGVLALAATIAVPPIVVDDLPPIGGAQLIATMLLVGNAAYRLSRTPGLVAFATLAVVPPATIVATGEPLWEFVFFALILAPAWVVGVLLRREQHRSAELAALAEELRHEREKQAEVAVTAERTRISRELHDTLLQSFQGLLLRFQSGVKVLPERPLEARQRLESAIDQAAAAITEGRDAVQGLRSSAFETNELANGIIAFGQELINTASTVDTPDIEVEVEGGPRNLNPVVRDEAYRIAGEALRNAFRHARARRITVEIRYDKRQFRLRVSDDGKGIDEETIRRQPAGHFGLNGMRERAEIAGGRLEVRSRMDSGTEVELSVPGAIAYGEIGRRSWLSKGI